MTSQTVPEPTTDEAPRDLHEHVREYYGRRLTSADDLQEAACCTLETQERHAGILEKIPGRVRERHYGCGCPLPDDDLTGLTVLDLGSGAGVDLFIASHLVGPEGRAIGLDFSAEQLAICRDAIPEVTRAFGRDEPNVEVHEGYIETAEPIPDGSVDLVISDCVVNLSPWKEEVARTIHRVLAPGGELHIADVVADRRVPETLTDDPDLVAECLGGALYENDWLDTLRDAGFGDPRVVRRTPLQRDVRGEPITFSSLVVRAFKLDDLDRRCEDYGQTATYLGTIEGSEARWALDDHHVFEKGRPTPVCRNTARMLSETRLGPHVEVTEPARHVGPFECGPSDRIAPGADPADAEACC